MSLYLPNRLPIFEEILLTCLKRHRSHGQVSSQTTAKQTSPEPIVFFVDSLDIAVINILIKCFVITRCGNCPRHFNLEVIVKPTTSLFVAKVELGSPGGPVYGEGTERIRN